MTREVWWVVGRKGAGWARTWGSVMMLSRARIAAARVPLLGRSG